MPLRALGLLSFLLLSGVGGARLEAAAPDPAPLRLEVSLSKRVLSVYVGDERVGSYPVAVGQPSHRTPTGTFHIGRVVWNPPWIPPASKWARNRKPSAPGSPNNPMGRVKMYFRYPAYYFHSTPDENSLGRAESHGCIRMLTSDAVALAKLVMEYGGEPRNESWFQNVLGHPRTTRTVDLASPILVTIHP